MGRLLWREDGSDLFTCSSTGVFFTRHSTGVFFTWPSLESSLLDTLVESSSLDPLWSLLHSTLSGVFFTRHSTGVFFTWPSLESSSLDTLLESSSLDPLWSLLCLTLYWSLVAWVSLSWPSAPPSLCSCVGCLSVQAVFWGWNLSFPTGKQTYESPGRTAGSVPISYLRYFQRKWGGGGFIDEFCRRQRT
jgi:hypothetical protein